MRELRYERCYKKIEKYKYDQIQKELERLENSKAIAVKWYEETSLSRFETQIKNFTKDIEELKAYLSDDNVIKEDIVNRYDKLKDVLNIVATELANICNDDSVDLRTKALLKFIKENTQH